MKKYIKRKKGKRNSISLGLPDHRNRVKITSIMYNKNGIVEDAEWPACKGECVDFVDFTNSRGGSVNFRPCQLCDGKGTATEDVDYKIVSFYDHKERQQIDFVKINKKGE